MELPTEGYVRIWQIIGCTKRGITPVIPVCAAAWWKGVKSGKYPKGIKLSPGVTVWRVADIRALLEQGVAA